VAIATVNLAVVARRGLRRRAGRGDLRPCRRDATAALGDEAFAAAWARGEAMRPEEIVTFAETRRAVRSPP